MKLAKRKRKKIHYKMKKLFSQIKNLLWTKKTKPTLQNKSQEKILFESQEQFEQTLKKISEEFLKIEKDFGNHPAAQKLKGDAKKVTVKKPTAKKASTETKPAAKKPVAKKPTAPKKKSS